MRIEKCWFCSSNIYPGHGTAFIRNDCKIFRFCRSKCHKHFKMKHNPRKMKWTKVARKSRGKEMTLDTTFDFEKKRNTAVRYDRDLWVKTVQAVKKVNKIRAVRKVRFHKQRLAAQLKKRSSTAQKEIARSQHLMVEPKLKSAVKEKLAKKIKAKKVTATVSGSSMDTA